MILRTLLVGAHFRPPARQLLEVLPAGAELKLDPEDNPYDENAIRVLVDPKTIAEQYWPLLRDQLPLYGEDWDELLAKPDDDRDIQLGYVAKTGGKPLEKAGLAVGNVEFKEVMSQFPWRATLQFGETGSPMVQIETKIDG